MSNEKKKISKVKVEKKINLNYLEFVSFLLKEKKGVNEKNKEYIKKEYENRVNLRWSNMCRVVKRVEREEVREKLRSILNEYKINEKELIKVNKELILISKKRSNNYF